VGNWGKDGEETGYLGIAGGWMRRSSKEGKWGETPTKPKKKKKKRKRKKAWNVIIHGANTTKPKPSSKNERESRPENLQEVEKKKLPTNPLSSGGGTKKRRTASQAS